MQSYYEEVGYLRGGISGACREDSDDCCKECQLDGLRWKLFWETPFLEIRTVLRKWNKSRRDYFCLEW